MAEAVVLEATQWKFESSHLYLGGINMIGIYKITNKTNGKVYIGQSIDIKKRWKQHINEAKSSRQNTYLYNAMRKYGIDNFSFEIIEECDIKSLNEREIYWIKFYNSFEGEGYNMTPGGSDPIKVNTQELYNLWDKGLSVGEIVNYYQGTLSASTIKNYLYCYKKWTKEESKKREGRIKSKTPLQKEGTVIKQYDIFGTFIKNWDTSLHEIERELKIPHNSISKVLCGKLLQSHGFQWKYGIKDDQSNIESIIDKVPLHFEILQKTKEGKIINRYKTVVEAAKAVNTVPSNIRKVCKHTNNRKTAKGYIWEYDFNTWYDT